MQAAFVDIGLEKNAYLSLDDLLATHGHRSSEKKPQINELIHEGEELLVQVVKEAIGTKAARVTSEISIAGRYLVYLPLGKKVLVSRKITDPAMQKRLQDCIRDHLDDQEGAIIRTQAAAADEKQLVAEISYLRSRWQKAVSEHKADKAPCLILAEGELISRYVRDALNEQISELVVDHLESYQQLKGILTALYPEYLDRLHYHHDSVPLFQRYGVDAQIDRLLDRQVPLGNGGFLVIDRTEAMTVIDVNTGRFTGQGGSRWEETVLRANLEAAAEIARQLRLRDIGGIVVIDFIDMKVPEHQEKVLERLRRELGKDPMPTRLAGMTKLGLVELTRKKERKNLADVLTQTCPACAGSGRVITPKETARRFLEEVSGLVRTCEAEAVVAMLDKEVRTAVTQAARHEALQAVDFMLLPSDRSLRPGAYSIIYAGSREEASRLYAQRKAESAID
jgi:ribonuclease G